MDNNLKLFPDRMGKNLTLKVNFSPNSQTILEKTIELAVLGPNLRSTELNGTHLFFNAGTENYKFLCSTEEEAANG